MLADGSDEVEVQAASLLAAYSHLVMKDSITAIGFQICFYLGLTGLACAWYYRGELTTGIWRAITHVIWPATSGVFLFFIAIYSIPTFDVVTNVVGMGGIAIGAIPLFLNRRNIWRPAAVERDMKIVQR